MCVLLRVSLDSRIIDVRLGKKLNLSVLTKTPMQIAIVEARLLSPTASPVGESRILGEIFPDEAFSSDIRLEKFLLQ